MLELLDRRGGRETALWNWRFAMALLVLYFLADIVLNKMALGEGWQTFWPLNGVTVGLLLQRPRRVWPLLLGAVTIGTGLGEALDNNAALSVVIQRMLSLLEVVVSASLLPPFVSLDKWLRKPGLYSRFTAAVTVGPAVSGLFAATYFATFEGKGWLQSFGAWALADALGMAAFLPLVLALGSAEARSLFSRQRRLASLSTLIAAVGVMAGIFTVSQYPLIFILYPLLMLVDWLLGVCGSSLALGCGCILAVFLTEHGFGPFAAEDPLGVSRNLAVQLYLGFHLLGFLPISILFLERRWMDKEMRDSLARAAALASIDGLTGVANRRSLDTYLQDQWRLSARRQTSLALMMIDVDHFKAYNDQFGHQGGDECLRTVASTLTAHVTRPGDVVARFGGEEFVILLPETPLEGAEHVAETIRTAVFDLAIAHPSGEARRVTVSIGCAAMIPRINTRYQHLVEAADQALYLAKRAGRNQVRASDPDVDIWTPGTAARKLRARIADYKQRRGY